jgi:hypothetical protein
LRIFLNDETMASPPRMQLLVFSIICLLHYTLASAGVAITNSNFSDITAGETFTITWANATGDVVINLVDEDPDLVTRLISSKFPTLTPAHEVD